MADDATNDEASYTLVMPFVVCASAGGSYDDAAFVAGVRFGQDSAELHSFAPDEWRQYVDPVMVRQYDLLAMQHGYTMTAEPWDEHPDEWTLVTFTKATGG